MAGDSFPERGDAVRALVAAVRSETCWTADGDPAAEVAAVEAGERRCGELFFDRPGTGARVVVAFPARGTGDLATLLVENPLDDRLTRGEEGFLGHLGAAHRAIAGCHRTAYTEPVADPLVVARARVPPDFDDGTLAATLASLDAVAVESDALHADLRAVLAEYVG